MNTSEEGYEEAREEAYKRAYDRAIQLLARRAHSTWELQCKLLRGKTSPEVVHRVCERCQALGYLDDADFALSRARYRLLHGHYGPERVRAELRSLHVDPPYIQQSLDTLLAETDVVHLATAALAKRFGNSPDDTQADEHGQRNKKRRYDYLARRGFNSHTIWQVLE